MKKQFFAAVMLLAIAASAAAQISVREPWIRATVPAGQATGAFMQLQSAQDARLVEVQTPAAGIVEIHQMSMQGDRMMMSAVDYIDLPAGKPVALASGGYHIMMMDLKRQMKAGETVPMTLVFEKKGKKRETLELQVPVKPLSYTAPKPH
ncbi:copper chaperone PCu(A)C [Pseudoduganella sp. DS3]|uniref:Copper chaperone PCu(A)C n=1 Tax=Pseudoduganella guangdongensis TaxID=2692179 RepID=A0A6N9HG80_9BURK|nr:copper chaperone PCu(A)C [Pseudoduganella guangdongensis]MYN02093.1 copper chaperone PCu(A)C [Pseudoduganella guangdongensis]